NEALRLLKYLSMDHLVLLHALNVPKPAHPMMIRETADKLFHEIERHMRAGGDVLFNRSVSLLPFHTGPVTRVLRMGSPAEIILTTAEQEKTDLIVMGARGLGPIKERLLGSVSHRILTSAPCAKLIVPGPVKPIRQVLLPLSSAIDTERAIQFLALKPFRQSVDLTLLSVLPDIPPLGGVVARGTETYQAR